MRNFQHGFTLVELVVTMVVGGIIAAVAMPRFAAKDTFDTRGFYDRATATVRYAQKLAIAQRREVFVCVYAPSAPAIGDISVSYASGCATPITDVSGVALKVSAPGGIALSTTTNGIALSPTTNFSFLGGLGETAAEVIITLTSSVAGDPVRSIKIENGTGYVHNG